MAGEIIDLGAERRRRISMESDEIERAHRLLDQSDILAAEADALLDDIEQRLGIVPVPDHRVNRPVIG